MNFLNFLVVLFIFFVFNSCKEDMLKDAPVSTEILLLTPTDFSSLKIETMPKASLLFSWEAAIGSDVTYSVVFDKTDEDFSNPVQTVISDDNGKKTYVSISRAKMDEIAGLMGIAVEGTGSFKWTVFAQRGNEIIKVEKSRTISVTRSVFDVYGSLSAGVYLTGAGTEAGDDIAKAMVLKSIVNGEYEIYTQLTAGQTYFFVNKTSDASRTFYTEDGQLREGDQKSTMGQSGIYRVYLNFNTGVCTYTEITKVSFYLNASQISVELPYIGFGVWGIDNTFSGLSGTNNTDRRYKFQMESATGETEWQAEMPSDGAPNGLAPYYFMREVESSIDGDLWTGPANWNNSWGIVFMLKSDAPYTHSLLQKNQTYAYGPDAVDWSLAADKSNAALIDYFWNPRLKYLNAATNIDHFNGNYWPQAHGLDVLVDAYLRTGDNFYRNYMDMWCEGVRAGNGHKWTNDFIDDMEWIGIAAIRAYKATGDAKFLQVCREVWDGTTDVIPYTPHPLNGMPTSAPNNGYYGIKRAWVDDNLGGIAWKSDQIHTRNACSNAPAAIVAALLYQEFGDEEDLAWAHKIYDWQRARLFKPSSGNVSDNIRWSSYLTTNTLTEGITSPTVAEGTGTLTYNQGTFIGIAVELYKITGETRYLSDAMAAANQVLNTKSTNNVISSETSNTNSDNAMFKGIFIRWFTQLIICDGISEPVRQRYISWLINNGGSLWTVGRNEKNWLSGNWRGAPTDPLLFTAQLSGCMLFEALAMLEDKGYF
ncbi:glycoside hydrolase family 76 protein [Gaoshiqia sp. Z1-71]|uniref:glycoside hydrolase family 76 protein n=1 Tax=Gaoshiqia hydrogeniformans TaxID=3290090 RepID=UPI003BF92578